METGLIGLGGTGQLVLKHLLRKTTGNLFVYDPDGRSCAPSAAVCRTAAELCEQCDTILLALESPADLTALCNGLVQFLREGQIFVDLTDTSPALAHAIANGMRRLGARYIDCGVFSADGLREPFLLFAGGDSEAFASVQPVIRCFAPDCRYMGPSGRGKAARLFCRALSAQLQECVGETASLARAFGIDGDYFLESLGAFAEISQPLAALGGGAPVFSPAELEADAALVHEMQRRALQNGERG